MLDELPEVLYGTVTIGDLWVFGKLERSTRRVTRDIGSFTLSDDLEELIKILVGILE